MNGIIYVKPPITMLGAQQIISGASDDEDDDGGGGSCGGGFLPPILLSGKISVTFTSRESSVYRTQGLCPLSPTTRGPFLALDPWLSSLARLQDFTRLSTVEIYSAP